MFKRKPAPEPEPQPAPTRTWFPEPGSATADVMAEIAALGRRDVWSGSRDTDRREA